MNKNRQNNKKYINKKHEPKNNKVDSIKGFNITIIFLLALFVLAGIDFIINTSTVEYTTGATVLSNDIPDTAQTSKANNLLYAETAKELEEQVYYEIEVVREIEDID